MSFTIDDAINECRDRARISELHHMPISAKQWAQTADWLEAFADLPDKLQTADFSRVVYQAEDTVFDIRDRQRDKTINEVLDLIEKQLGGTHD